MKITLTLQRELLTYLNNDMKRIVFLMIVLFTAGMVSAQQKEASITAVGSAVYDFGDIKESDGSVSHTFTVINNGELPLKISRVIASCGCTQPKWTEEPIAPGKTGEIKVTVSSGSLKAENILITNFV